MAGNDRVSFILDLQTRKTISALAHHYCTSKRDTIKRIVADAGRALLKNKKGTKGIGDARPASSNVHRQMRSYRR